MTARQGDGNYEHPPRSVRSWPLSAIGQLIDIPSAIDGRTVPRIERGASTLAKMVHHATHRRRALLRALTFQRRPSC